MYDAGPIMAGHERPFARVLQHVAPEGPGRIAEALESAGFDVALTRIDRGEPVPKTLDGAAALVVMGGPMGVYEADVHPHLRDELRLIETALRAEAPFLGVCLGSQLLAAALGARVYPGSKKEIGWFPITTKDASATDPVFANAPRTFDALHWHGDVFELPNGAVSLARSALTKHQAFRHGACAYGVLFHLEADAQQVRAMTTTFADELTAENIAGDALVAKALTLDPETVPIASSLYGAFARLIRTR